MKRLIKFLAVIMATILFACCFVGCKDKKDDNINDNNIGKEYGVEIVEDYDVKLSWYNEHKTYGAYYKDAEGNIFYDKTSPETRTTYITNEEQFYKVFENEIKIDFSKQIIVVFCFSAYDFGTPIIEDIFISEEGVLVIKFSLFFDGYTNTTITRTEIVVAKANKNYKDKLQFERYWGY